MLPVPLIDFTFATRPHDTLSAHGRASSSAVYTECTLHSTLATSANAGPLCSFVFAVLSLAPGPERPQLGPSFGHVLLQLLHSKRSCNQFHIAPFARIMTFMEL